MIMEKFEGGLQKRPIVPPFLYDILASHEIYGLNIKHICHSDLSCDNIRCDSFTLVTDDKIYVIDTIVGLENAGKFSIFRKVKLTQKATLLNFSEYNRQDFTEYVFEEYSASGTVIGRKSDNSGTALVSCTNSSKDELRELHNILNDKDEGIKNKHEHKHFGDMPHPDGHGGHGGPHHGPHGDKREGKFSHLGPMYCPKCGKKYSNPRTRVCVSCMDKNRVLSRLFELIMRYKFQVLASIVILVLTGALSIITPYISSGFYYDEVLNVSGDFYGQLILVLSLIIGTKLLSVGVNILNSLVSCRIAAKLRFDLKDTIFSSIERLSLEYFTDKQTGALMTQVTSDSNTIYWFFTGGIPYFLVNIVQIISVVIIMFVIKPDLTAMYLITVPFIFIIMKTIFSSMGKFHERRFATNRAMNALVSDNFSGMRIVKSFAREKNGSERFEKASETAANADRIASRYNTLMSPFVQLFMTVSNLLVLGVGGWMVIEGKLNYGELLTFTAYTNMIYSPLNQFVHMTYQATDSLNAMSRLVEIMEATADIKESDNPVSKESLDGDIVFEQVNFGYNKAYPVLKNINFDIKGGSILGVVGHTGAGKSTLANLLMRMYDVNSGEIRIDGFPLKELSIDTIRRNVAIVSQETYLFVGSILDNIRYACPEASYEDVIRASKIAGAHDFIIKLPDGYHTPIGFGNRDLSGGEKQRISIARALLRDPSILILDEATAAMDTQTERKIQDALEILIEGKTTIMIAHRLSTLRMADKLVVLKNGEICEEGTPAELLQKKGEYYKLYSLQLAALKNVGVEG